MRAGPSDLAPWNVWDYYPCRERGQGTPRVLSRSVAGMMNWFKRRKFFFGGGVRVAAARGNMLNGNDWRFGKEWG